MKKILLLILVTAFLFIACEKDLTSTHLTIPGCMDSLAINYHPEATIDNGNCNYEPITDLNIYFKHYVDGTPLVVNDMIYTNQANDNYSIQTLRYLISDITLHTDNSINVFHTNTLLDEVHFIDISIDSTLTLHIPEIIGQNYTSISFTMGLDSIKNITNLFLNENFFPSFAWPEFLGGGYHYMQLEGDFNDSLSGYATHTGGTNGIDFSFKKTFPIIINSTNNVRDININMELNNWYQNPNTINLTTNGIMENINQQILLQANGEDVFLVN